MALLVAVLVVVFYWPAGRFGFAGVDDEHHILGHTAVMQPSTEGYWDIWRRPHFNMYIPTTYTLWAAINHISSSLPEDPAKFHLANVAVHAGNAVLVFLLACMLHCGPARAVLAALFFALHPLQVESVAWISGMKDLASSGLLLMGLVLTLHSLSENKTLGLAGGMISYALGILAKPVAVVGAGLLLVLSLAHPGLGVRVLRSQRWLMTMALWSFLGVAGIMLARWAQPAVAMPFELSLAERLLVALWSLDFYMLKVVLPWPLALDYALPPDVILTKMDLGPLTMGLLLLPVGLLLLAKSGGAYYLAASLCFFIALLPSLGLVSYYYQAISNVADRYAYLAMLGPALIVCRWPLPKARTAKSGSVLLAAAAATMLLALSWSQTKVWQEPLSLFQHAVQVTPHSWFAHFNLGSALIKHGRLAEARYHLELTTRMRPWFPDAHHNLAVLSQMEGKVEEAKGHFAESQRLDQHTPRAVYRP